MAEFRAVRAALPARFLPVEIAIPAALLRSPRRPWAGTAVARQVLESASGPSRSLSCAKESPPVAAIGELQMLYWSVVFFIVALIAAMFGFFGVVSAAASIAKVLFVVFAVLFVISLLTGLRGRTTSL